MFSSILTIARFSLIEAIRGKIIWIIAALLVLAIMLSLFIGQTSLTETRESQVALMAGFLRVSSILVMIFFVVASIARDFQDKSIELLFAVSIPRYQIFIGKFFGFSLVSFLIAVFYFFTLLFYSEAEAAIVWSISFWFELSLVALLSLIFILSLENVALSLMMSIGMYVLMRLMPAIQSMGEGPMQDGLFNQFINLLIDIIGLFLPRLDLFSQSSWLIVNEISSIDIISFLIEFALYVIFFILVGVFDLKRKAI